MKGNQLALQFDTPSPSAPDSRHKPTAHRNCTRHIAPIASGEKAKARDILAAIRTLKAIEQEQRPATPEEKQTLARFAGFGPVALSIFPDPVTGRYKDAGWQALGEELKIAAHARGIRQRQAHHLQRLLHVADRHRGHARGHRPPRRARQRHRSWSRAAAPAIS